MNVLSIIMLVFAIIGAVDKLCGDRLRLGTEFDRGFHLLGPMALSMVGMIIIAPALGVWLKPFFEGFYSLLGIDPSIIPSSLFANDMGGTSLSMEIMKNTEMGMYNALVVSSLMGTVISYTIPFGAGLVNKSQHKDMFFGFLCGIVAIPIGCLVSGLFMALPILPLLLNLLPLLLISLVVALGLIFAPSVTVKIFTVFGFIMNAIIIVGLVIGIFTTLTGITVSEHFGTMEEGAVICFNASVTLAGAFPLMSIVSRLLRKPMSSLGKKLKINSDSVLTLITNFVTNAITFGNMGKMDPRGVVLNSALAVTVSFAFGSHLGFTMAYDSDYVFPMIVAKLTSGAIAFALALFLYKKDGKAETVSEQTPDPA